MLRPHRKLREARPTLLEPASVRLTLGLAAFAALVALGQGVRRRRLRGLDRKVRRDVRPKGDRRLTNAARVVCTVAEPRVHPLIASAIAAAAWPRIGSRALRIPAAALVSTALDRAARYVVQQHRPPGASKHPGRDRYAFPSGHTTAATAIALATALELTGPEAPVLRRTLPAMAVLVAATVGGARLYLDEHWADDVIGGWLAGTGIACTLTALMPDA
ncbi:MAG TPA: phosphatase PAP2 family protein [Candidatus Elarobacter sp.]|nr:phosphatase PAP2 family protein [Candidatus Elarobacter sp.]